jgi:hypothetical protein
MSKIFTASDIKNSKVAHLNQHLFTAKPDKKKRNKYRNEKVEFDGKTFDSIKEMNRYITLRMLQTAGDITDLACQVEFILEAEDKKVCSYFADFVYKVIKTGLTVVEDVKSKATRRLAVYRLKKKLMFNCFGIEIKEV